MYDIGSKIKTLREKRGLTQKELAEKVCKSVSAISGYETDAQTPPTDVLISIALALRAPITYFVECNNDGVYSTAGMTEDQIEVVDLIFQEFSAPSNGNRDLTQKQIEIIQKLILIFSKGYT